MAVRPDRARVRAGRRVLRPRLVFQAVQDRLVLHARVRPVRGAKPRDDEQPARAAVVDGFLQQQARRRVAETRRRSRQDLPRGARHADEVRPQRDGQARSAFVRRDGIFPAHPERRRCVPLLRFSGQPDVRRAVDAAEFHGADASGQRCGRSEELHRAPAPVPEEIRRGHRKPETAREQEPDPAAVHGRGCAQADGRLHGVQRRRKIRCTSASRKNSTRSRRQDGSGVEGQIPRRRRSGDRAPTSIRRTRNFPTTSRRCSRRRRATTARGICRTAMRITPGACASTPRPT